uniref:30S ribosomal protein S10, chloroplastic n=1 Tax=Cyanidium sp. THAL103 TaxID=3027999 RepID=A0A9Y1MXY2_9RHOD|nr:ribosomal protein S10 [Cyanidium sp. THAL103]
MEIKQRIRIKLNAYQHDLLNISCLKIKDIASRTLSRIVGPVFLPTKRKIYCVLRSPHVNKDSREHFEIRIHRRIIDIHRPSSETIDALMKLDLPAGIDIEIKINKK